VREILVPPDKWFTLEVLADDNHIVIKVDGRVTADFIDADRQFSLGRLALQQHDPQTVVRFHKIEIKTGKPGAAAIIASSPGSDAPGGAEPPRDAKPADPLARARSDHDVALKKADEALAARFDKEINALRRGQMKSDERIKLIDAVKLEKATFESKKTIPWSSPMRPAVLNYLRDVAVADGALNKEYERSIAARLKIKDDAKAEQLKAELARMFPARLIGVWVFQDRDTWRFYSDGTWMILGKQGQLTDATRTWSLNVKELVMKRRLTADPGKVLIDHAAISDDGQTMIDVLQDGNRLTLKLQR
jgi:hypothetical protein